MLESSLLFTTRVFFPITNDTQRDQETNSSITTVVGSPVLAATVGSELSSIGMAEPVRILLQLNEELEVRGQKVSDVLCCVCDDLGEECGSYPCRLRHQLCCSRLYISFSLVYVSIKMCVQF